MTDLVKRTYRITKAEDKTVKKAARSKKTSESGIVREAIENLPPSKK